MDVNWNVATETETLNSNQIKLVVPKSGWDYFINELLGFKIMTLPNMDNIPGLPLVFDGDTYDVEIATQNEYRFYSYCSPTKFENRFWQAKCMSAILNLISRELK